MEKLEKQAKLFQDRDIRVLSEQEIDYGPEWKIPNCLLSFAIGLSPWRTFISRIHSFSYKSQISLIFRKNRPECRFFM